MKGAEAVVKTLISQGVKVVFGVPGETYVSVLDEFASANKSIKYFGAASEETAAYAAASLTQISGPENTIGVTMSTRAPGAVRNIPALYTAKRFSVPMVHLAAHAPSDMIGHDGTWQNVDFKEGFSEYSKEVLIAQPVGENPKYFQKNIADTIAEAFKVAKSGRPGPVVVVMPSDVLEQELGDIKIPEKQKAEFISPDTNKLDQAYEILKGAQRPIIIAGEIATQGRQYEEQIAKLAEKTGAVIMNDLPNPHFLAGHKNFGGNLGVKNGAHVEKAIAASDAVVYVGGRMSELGTARSYSPDKAKLFSKKNIVQIFPDDSDIKRPIEPAVQITGNLASSLEHLGNQPYKSRGNQRKWVEGVSGAQRDFVLKEYSQAGDMNITTALRQMKDILPENALIATDDGAFYLHMTVLDYKKDQQVVGAKGAMAGGLGRAIGMKGAYPDRKVALVVGDGGFNMSAIGELTKTIEHDLPINVIIMDNNYHLAIGMHQHKRAGEFKNKPGFQTEHSVKQDFTKVAEGLGVGYAKQVSKTEDFANTFAEALEFQGTSVIQVKYSPRNVSPEIILPNSNSMEK